MGRPEAAEVAREAVLRQIEVLGPDHPDMKLCMANVALIEKSSGSRDSTAL